MAVWTEEAKEELIAAYEAQNPTSENTMEVVAKIIEGMDGVTVNGARNILSRAGVWIKKVPAKGTAAGSKAIGEKKESKADSIARLEKVIAGMDIEVDDTITSKLTGKAAAYFADTITAIVGED